MAPEQRSRPEGDESYDIDDVLKKLDELEDSVSSNEERHDVRQARRVAERVPGSKRISKYTIRDVSEGAVGAIVFSLPLLVEDGSSTSRPGSSRRRSARCRSTWRFTSRSSAP